MNKMISELNCFPNSTKMQHFVSSIMEGSPSAGADLQWALNWRTLIKINIELTKLYSGKLAIPQLQCYTKCKELEANVHK